MYRCPALPSDLASVASVSAMLNVVVGCGAIIAIKTLYQNRVRPVPQNMYTTRLYEARKDMVYKALGLLKRALKRISGACKRLGRNANKAAT